jgi:hypothetical protein
MESAHITPTTGRFAGASHRRSALHLLAEIRVTSRGKQVQFYWAAGEPGDQSGHAGPVWRTIHSAALDHSDRVGLARR